MSERNEVALRRLYDEAMSQGKLEVVDEVVSSEMVDHESGNNGIEGVKETLGMFRTAFPDLSVSVEDVLADGDKVVGRVVFRGTHTGDFMGIAPTGKQVSIDVIDIVRFADGKAIEHWGISDNLGMLEQLGVAPPMG